MAISALVTTKKPSTLNYPVLRAHKTQRAVIMFTARTEGICLVDSSDGSYLAGNRYLYLLSVNHADWEIVDSITLTNKE